MKQVFISYRRGSGLYMAKNIATYLSSHGYKVFFDYDSMQNGVFDKQIYTAIENSNDFILVLTENALDNCSDPNDWVRAEILHAKKYNKNFILATDAERFKSYPSNLPPELEFLKKIDWTPIHPKLFGGSMDILTRRWKSRSNKLKALFASTLILSVALIALLAYLYIPMKTTTMYIDDDEELPLNVFSDFDVAMDEDDFDDFMPQEIDVFFACTASTDRYNQVTMTVEDAEEINAEAYGLTENEVDAYLKMLAAGTVRDYYLSVRKSISLKQLQLKEDFSPIEYKTGNFEWIIYRFFNSDIDKEIWRASAKLSNTLFLNVIVNTNKANLLTSKRFLINFKRFIKNSDPILMKYVDEEYF